MIISTTRKIHAIANALQNQPPGIDPADLDEPWATYFKFIRGWIDDDPEDVDLMKLRMDFTNNFSNLVDKAHGENIKLISEAIKNPVTYQPIGAYLDELPDVQWLWKDWIALGVITILAAPSGTGKSYVALDLARRVINDGQFPDDSQVLKPSPVLYVDSENAPSLYKSRIGVWTGEERDQLYYMRADPNRFALDLDAIDDRDRFLDQICVLQPVLVIIDSYGSASSGGTNKKQDIQGLIGFLNRIAIDYQLSVVLVHHIRKSIGDNGQNGTRLLTLDSIFGSMYITAWTRNVLIMQQARWWDKNGPRRLWCEKSNAGVIREPLGVSFKPHPLNSAVAQLEYGPAPDVDEEKTKATECRTWLLNVLREEGEPVKPRDILALGELEGYNQRMIHRVRKELDGRVRNTEGRFSPDNCWELVEENVAQPEAASSSNGRQASADAEIDVMVKKAA